MATLTLHASAVACNGMGILIRGRAGSGKSRLAVEMIALGAYLISDDQTIVTAVAGGLTLAPPASIAGMLEMRGIGLIRLPFRADVPLSLLVDMDHAPSSRLPEILTTDLLERPVRTISGSEQTGLAAALTVLGQSGIAAMMDPDAPFKPT